MNAGRTRLAIRELKRGRYRLTAVPTDPAGNVGRARSVRMMIR